MENIEHTLLQLEHKLSQVVIRRDTALLERLLDETYVFTNAGGEVKNKAQTLTKFRALVDSVQFDFSTNSDLRVQVYGDAAVVTGAQAQQGSYKRCTQLKTAVRDQTASHVGSRQSRRPLKRSHR